MIKAINELDQRYKIMDENASIPQPPLPPTQPPSVQVPIPAQTFPNQKSFEYKDKTYTIELPYLTGSAFQKLAEGISDPAPYYTDKELRQFVNAYKESSWSTKNYLKPSTATFKSSIFE